MKILLAFLIFSFFSFSSAGTCTVAEFNDPGHCSLACGSCQTTTYNCTYTSPSCGTSCSSAMSSAGFSSALVSSSCTAASGGMCFLLVYTSICTCGISTPIVKNINKCATCREGYFGANCTVCPNCNQGVCNSGIAGTGLCSCSPGWSGTLCDACADGYYGSSCQACPACEHGTCFQGISGTGQCVCAPGWAGPLCTTCAPGYYGPSCLPCQDCQQGVCQDGIANNGSCTCAAGWEKTLPTGPCNKCKAGYFGASCTQCPQCVQGTCNAGLTGNGTCMCSPGFTGALCNTCLPGHYGASCLPCKDCGNGVCSSGISGSGQCTCQAEWRLDGNGTCSLCQPGRFGPSCEACQNCGSHGTCLEGVSGSGACSCQAGYQTDGPSICATCVQGYYSSSGSCLACSHTCLNCSGSSTNCTSCPGDLTVVDGVCASECPPHNYFDTIVTHSCQPCASDCGDCFGGAANQCLTCDSSKVFYQHGCPLSCPVGYYNQSGVCLACDTSCATCSETSGHCLTCPSNLVFHQFSCLSSCPSANLYVDGQSTCQACHPSCGSCTGPADTQCTSCSNVTDFLNQGTCASTCPPHHFPQGSVCGGCSSTCNECSGATSQDCLSCDTGSPRPYFQDGSCVSSCSQHQFLNGTVCQTCDNSCLLCSGSSASECLVCSNSNHYMLNGACLTSCPAIGSYVLNANQRTCGLCDSSCRTCDGGSPTDCLTCGTGNVLYFGQCRDSCPSGFYPDENSVCHACQGDCSSCAGPLASDCLTCASAKRSVNITNLEAGSGPCACNADTFEYPTGSPGYLSRDCWHCVSACAYGRCSYYDPSFCLQCKEGNILSLTVPGSCEPSPAAVEAFRCGEGEFVSGPLECTPCPPGSSTPDQNKLTICQCNNTGFSLSLSDNSSCEACPENTYLDPSGYCLGCPARASSPAASVNLTSCQCDFGYFLDVQQKTCEVPTCPTEDLGHTTYEATVAGNSSVSVCDLGYYFFQEGKPVRSIRYWRRCVLSLNGSSAEWEAAPKPTCQVTCLVNGCANNGFCVDTVSTAGPTCLCQESFFGYFCDQNSTQVEEIDWVPIYCLAGIAVLLLGIWLLMRWKFPDASNSIVLTISFSIFDVITDVFFCIDSHTREVPYVFEACIAFLVLPAVFNLVVMVFFLVREIRDNHDLEAWINQRHTVAAVAAMLGLLHAESFNLLASQLFYWKIFSAPISALTIRSLQVWGIISIFCEDIPQLVLQIYVAVYHGRLSTITLISMIGSGLGLGFGLLKRLLIFLMLKYGPKAKEERMRRTISRQSSVMQEWLAQL